MAPLVAVVDDDISVRESLEGLISSVGLEVRLSASAEEFLSSAHPRKPACLVLAGCGKTRSEVYQVLPGAADSSSR